MKTRTIVIVMLMLLGSLATGVFGFNAMSNRKDNADERILLDEKKEVLHVGMGENRPL